MVTIYVTGSAVSKLQSHYKKYYVLLPKKKKIIKLFPGHSIQRLSATHY